MNNKSKIAAFILAGLASRAVLAVPTPCVSGTPYTSTTACTVPAGVTSIAVQVWGGGGGGDTSFGGGMVLGAAEELLAAQP